MPQSPKRRQPRIAGLETLHLRLPPGLRGELNAAAQKSGRSLSSEVSSQLHESLQGEQMRALEDVVADLVRAANRISGKASRRLSPAE